MSDDFDEFLGIVGQEVETYRYCAECTELVIVNPETYDKPKCECDPGFCPYHIPWCLCDELAIWSLEKMKECTWPECRCGIGKEQSG